jgi:hypothetical protein
MLSEDKNVVVERVEGVDNPYGEFASSSEIDDGIRTYEEHVVRCVTGVRSSMFLEFGRSSGTLKT